MLVLLFGAWLAWLVFGRVTVYSASEQSHLEAERLPEPIQSAVDGVVVDCNISLAQRVKKGEVLVRLDSQIYQLQLAEAQANLDAALNSISTIEHEIEVELRARDVGSRLVGESERAGRAKIVVSRTADEFQRKEADIFKLLNDRELASKLEQLRSEQQSATNHAAVTATSAEAARETGQQVAALVDRDVQIAALRKVLADAKARSDVLRATLAITSFEIERRQVKSSIDGDLVDILPCTPGMTITSSQRLATLLPDSEIRVVSLFRPQDAVGRIMPGQQTIIRVDNFPWTQFGTLGATVDRIGTEPRDGFVRVEMTITRKNSSIPVVHGLTGRAEVLVETTSPLHLLLRSLGQKLLSPSSTQVVDSSAGERRSN